MSQEEGREDEELRNRHKRVIQVEYSCNRGKNHVYNSFSLGHFHKEFIGKALLELNKRVKRGTDTPVQLKTVFRNHMINLINIKLKAAAS